MHYRHEKPQQCCRKLINATRLRRRW